MWPKHPIVLALIFLLMTVLLACQPGRASPTLQLGEEEVSFETVVLAEEGAVQLTEGPQLFAVTNRDEATRLQPLISPPAFQQILEVDFATYNIVALFRIPGSGCAGVGITVEHLIRKEDTLTVYTHDWRPASGHTCAETSLSAYHLIKVSKNDIGLDEVKFVLQNQHMERSN